MNCQKRDCTERATHAIKLCVPRVGQSEDATHLGFLMGILLCEDHVDEAEAKSFLDQNPETLKPMFNVMMAGGPPPDFSRAYIEGVSTSDPEYTSMVLQSARKAH